MPTSNYGRAATGEPSTVISHSPRSLPILRSRRSIPELARTESRTTQRNRAHEEDENKNNKLERITKKKKHEDSLSKEPIRDSGSLYIEVMACPPSSVRDENSFILFSATNSFSGVFQFGMCHRLGFSIKVESLSGPHRDCSFDG